MIVELPIIVSVLDISCSNTQLHESWPDANQSYKEISPYADQKDCYEEDKGAGEVTWQ